jgi:hypothetical protein
MNNDNAVAEAEARLGDAVVAHDLLKELVTQQGRRLSRITERVEALETENVSLKASMQALHKRQLTVMRTTASGRHPARK